MAPPRGFAYQEFEARTARAQAAMARRGVEGVLLTSEAEIRYFSGFHTLFWQSPTRPWFLYLPASGKPIAIIPEIGAALMRRGWLKDIRTWAAPCPKDDGISLLVDLLAPLAARGATLGLMMGHETHLHMPLADYQRLLEALPGLKLADVTGEVQALRWVKSPAEIAKIAHICGIAGQAFAQADALFHEGQPLEEAFAAFRIACLKLGADDVPYLVGGAAQGGYDDVISPPTAAPLRAGDVLMLDTGATFDGYFCDFDRNFAMARADDASRRAYDVLFAATEAGLDAARPGATCAAVFAAMQRVITRHSPDAGAVGRLGHGLGMQLTEQPSLAGFDTGILQENMVITLEPSLSYGACRMMVHEENIVVQNGAPRLLSPRAPAALPIIGGRAIIGGRS